MRRTLKFIILSGFLFMVSAPAFATIDIPNIIVWMMINMSVKGEASNNESARKDLVKINKIFGEAGGLPMQLVDVGASVPFNSYAPIVIEEIQPYLDRGGYANIPEIQEEIRTYMTLLNSADMESQANVLADIDMRLNLNSTNALQKAKNVLALSNKAPDEADAQLKLSGDQQDLHHRFIQEMAQDIQLYKRDISLNQLRAQLLETTAMGIITDMQHSTLDIPEELKEVGISVANPE